MQEGKTIEIQKSNEDFWMRGENLLSEINGMS
jgi:hypothetical protein